MVPRRPLLAPALLVAVLLVVAPTARAGRPGEVTSFKVRACSAGSLAPASSEGVLSLICERRPGGKEKKTLGHLLPDGAVTRGPVPQSAVGPIAAGPAGEVWTLADDGTEGLGLDRIAADGSVTQIPLGKAQEGDTLEAYGLLADGEGAAWVAIGELAPEWYFHPYDSLGGELLHVAADGTVARFPVPEGVEPQALVRGPDGNLWFCGERGRYSTEHTSYLGKGYVGRMTPAGEFALFPSATEQSSPGGIAVGPEGRLWFTETSDYAREIGSIGTDGAFGPSLRVRNGFLQGSIAFGPEGDPWLSVRGGVMRITPQDQQTVFPSPEASDVVVGAEGDIWTRDSESIERIVPGAPGIDTVKIEVDRARRTADVELACGGSDQRCVGILELSLPGGRGRRGGSRLVRARYSVAAESRRNLTIHLSVRALALARQALPRHAGPYYVGAAIVHATVAGGPTLRRRIWVPGLYKSSRS